MENTDFHTTVRLLRKARGGDGAAVEDLFTRYLPKVRQIVALRLGYPLRDFATYEDLVQEALLRAFEKLDTFEERSEGTFYNWMATCVQTSINLHFRKEGARKRGKGKIRALRSEGLAGMLLKAGVPGPTTVVRARETEDMVEEILLSLKSHHREIITLRHLCGMSSPEIAEAMGFSNAATARKMLSRALEAFKAKLPDDLVSLT